MRYLAIDPGEKKIGLAVSDLLGVVARPLEVLAHVSTPSDVQRIAAIASAHEVDVILVGAPLGEGEEAGMALRRAERLAAALRTATQRPVWLCDESGSTAEAREARLAAGHRRKSRRTADDAVAAAVILQTYLDTLHHTDDI